MAQNSKLSLSRRDFLRLSALAAGGAALANVLPHMAFAQDTVELTTMSPGRDLGVAYDQVIIDTFNANEKAAGKPYHARRLRRARIALARANDAYAAHCRSFFMYTSVHSRVAFHICPCSSRSIVYPSDS